MFAWGIGAKTEGDAPRKVRIINCNSMAGKKCNIALKHKVCQKGKEKKERKKVRFYGTTRP